MNKYYNYFRLYINNNDRCFDFFWKIYYKDHEFSKIIDDNLAIGKIRFFNDEEWDKIKAQNFVSPIEEMKEFIDMFILGYNVGNCVGASRQLSYSYNNVDMVSGTLPLIKGTLNAEKEGGHCWLETPDNIIDTSLLLVIDKSLKEKLGYLEEERLTSFQLASNLNYQLRKEFANDKNINSSKKK